MVPRCWGVGNYHHNLLCIFFTCVRKCPLSNKMLQFYNFLYFHHGYKLIYNSMTFTSSQLRPQRLCAVRENSLSSTNSPAVVNELVRSQLLLVLAAKRSVLGVNVILATSKRKAFVCMRVSAPISQVSYNFFNFPTQKFKNWALRTKRVTSRC